MTVIARPLSGGRSAKHVGIQEALADPDDRVSERGGVQLGVEAAAAALKIDKPLQGCGHAGRGDAAAPGKDPQRSVGVGLD